MSNPSRLVVALGAVIVLVVAFVVLSPGEDDDSPTAVVTQSAPPTADTTPTAPAATSTTTSTAPARRPAPPAARRISVRGGQPVGGPKEISVERGDRVRLVVTADAPEEVHLHGYDISRDVGPGRAARYDFRADAEGVFEIELEHSAVKIADLEVRPR